MTNEEVKEQILLYRIFGMSWYGRWIQMKATTRLLWRWPWATKAYKREARILLGYLWG